MIAGLFHFEADRPSRKTEVAPLDAWEQRYRSQGMGVCHLRNPLIDSKNSQNVLRERSAQERIDANAAHIRKPSVIRDH